MAFALAVVGALLAAAGSAAPSAGQEPDPISWATLSQRVDIDMSAGDGSADVSIRYRLGPAEEGDAVPSSEPITLELLGFGDATVGEVALRAMGSVAPGQDGVASGQDRVASGQDRVASGQDGVEPGQDRPESGPERRIVLWPTVGSHRVAVMEPPFQLVETPSGGEEAPVGDEGPLSLTVSYRIENALEGEGVVDRPGSGTDAGEDPSPMIHARIPILTGPPVRAQGGGEAFSARVRVPETWMVSEGFPSGLDVGDDGIYAVSLTVAPSVVGFRASTDGRWRLGFPLLVDLLTLLILTAFAGFGWRHLRGVAA